MAAAGLIIELSSNNRREKPYLYQIIYEVMQEILINTINFIHKQTHAKRLFQKPVAHTNLDIYVFITGENNTYLKLYFIFYDKVMIVFAF